MQKLLNYGIISEDNLVLDAFADQLAIAASGFMFCLSCYSLAKISIKSETAK